MTRLRPVCDATPAAFNALVMAANRSRLFGVCIHVAESVVRSFNCSGIASG